MNRKLWVDPGDPAPEVEMTDLGQLMVPRTFTAHVSADDGSPDVTLRFEIRNGAPECREVNIQATEGGQEVRCSGLAGVRIEDVLEEALKQMMFGKKLRNTGRLPRWIPPAADDLGSLAVRDSRAARAARKVTITDELLREVAQVYRANLDANPTQAVADHFDRAHRTAALYVKRARESGHLGPATRGKAGE